MEAAKRDWSAWGEAGAPQASWRCLGMNLTVGSGMQAQKMHFKDMFEKIRKQFFFKIHFIQ